MDLNPNQRETAQTRPPAGSSRRSLLTTQFKTSLLDLFMGKANEDIFPGDVQMDRTETSSQMSHLLGTQQQSSPALQLQIPARRHNTSPTLGKGCRPGISALRRLTQED
jgi:hypothetical protein